MKKILAIAIGSMLVLGGICRAQTPSEQLYTCSPEAQKAVLDELLGKYADDPDKMLKYTTIIKEAFEKYFNDENTKVNVLEFPKVVTLTEQKDSLLRVITLQRDSLESVLTKKDEELTKLKTSDYQKQIDDLTAKYNRCDSLYKESLSEITGLNEKLDIFNGILADLDKEREAIYQDLGKYQTASLDNVKDASSLKTSMDVYEKNMTIFRQPIPEDYNNRKKALDEIMKAAEAYNEAAAFLDGKYNAAKATKAIKTLQNAQLLSIDDAQKKQLADMATLIENEDAILQNFNSILDKELNRGLIADKEIMEQALNSIDSKMKLINGDDPSDGAYHIGYRYINSKMKELKEGIRKFESKKYDDDKSYKAFIEGIRKSLQE